MVEKKRYLRVMSSLNPEAGGVVTAVLESVKYHNLVGDEIFDIVCFDDSRESFHELDGVDVFNFPSFSSYRMSFDFFLWLYRNAKNYDAVILDGVWQFYIASGFLLKALGVPYFVFTHGMLDKYFNRFPIKVLKKIPFWFVVERNILQMAAGVIFTTVEERDASIYSFPLFRGNVLISPLGIEGANLKNRNESVIEFYESFPELEGKEFFLFLSRIHEKKGFDILLDLLSSDLFLGRLLVIAGPDDNDYAKSIKSEIDRRRISDRVIWTGMLRDEKKWGALYCADLFILPSHQENFGLVVPEALSSGLPVLISNKVNIFNDILTYNAGLVCNDTAESLIAGFSEWLEFSERRSEFEMNALNCFSECYSRELAAHQFSKVLRANDCE
ncbi:MAG: glycosyltransferase involved in cell wall biosynthesis [Flavobacteriales bacterium]|jgi:glycosyltransferase involved in cell wall biosynthesis